MDKVGLCNVLRRHVSVGEKKKDKAKAMDLLDRGHITAAISGEKKLASKSAV
jgi:hypothetical protein